MDQSAIGDLPGQLARVERRLARERDARFEAEAIAEKGLRELYERQEELQLLEAIAGAANQMSSVDEALQFAVTKICAFTGWPLGHAYLTENHDELKHVHPAIGEIDHPKRLHEFLQATEQIRFDSGVGLPGRVLATGSPVWISDVAEDNNFPRAKAAREAGLKAAFADGRFRPSIPR